MKKYSNELPFVIHHCFFSEFGDLLFNLLGNFSKKMLLLKTNINKTKMSFGTYNYNAGSSTKIPEKIPHFFMAVTFALQGRACTFGCLPIKLH
jgi:hypothetical protein